jgi:hypothetical protein
VLVRCVFVVTAADFSSCAKNPALSNFSQFKSLLFVFEFMIPGCRWGVDYSFDATGNVKVVNSDFVVCLIAFSIVSY